MEEQFVDVRYRGLDAGRRLRISPFASGQAYLEHSAPMPVGTRLEIAMDDGRVVVVRVTGVTEQVAGADRAPGMRVVWLESREGDAAPADGEPAASDASGDAPGGSVAAEDVGDGDAGVPAAEPDADDADAPAAEPDPDREPGDGHRASGLGTADTQSLTEVADLAALESAATLDLSRAAVAQAAALAAATADESEPDSRRDTARTQVMSVSDLQAALAESERAVDSPDPAGSDDPGLPELDGPDDQPARKPVTTEVMFAIAAPAAIGEEPAALSPPREPDGAAKARGKRRRRRRRKTRS